MQAVPLFDLKDQFASVREAVAARLDATLDSQQFTLGPEVAELEQAFAALVGTNHAIGCASGTDALLLTLRVHAERSGTFDSRPDVIVPAFTFFATAGAAWNAGLQPVFCDVDRDTFNVTADTVTRALTDRTVAVVPVHLFGQMAPVEGISETLAGRGHSVDRGLGSSDWSAAPDR